MYKTKNKATLEGQDKRAGISIDVNFDKKYTDCVRINLGKSRAIIKKSDLFQILFMVSNEQQQEAMIPIKKEAVRPYKKQHMVKLQKDMKAGEELVVNCTVHVPLLVEEALKKEFIAEGKEVHESHLMDILKKEEKVV